MSKEISATYLIPFRDSYEGKTRTRNVLFIIDKMKQIPRLDILLLEQSENETKTLREILEKKDVRYFHLKNPGLFNKGWAYNCAIKHLVPNEAVFLADGDTVVLELESIEKALEQMENFDVVKPHFGTNRLTESQTLEYMEKGIVGEGDVRPRSPLMSGVVCIRKEAYLRINGFDERFEGWGCEDNEMAEHLERSRLRIKRLEYGSIHLDHERGMADTQNSNPHYQRNRDIWLREKRKKVEIGQFNKYSG